VKPLREHLADLTKDWDDLPIRVLQDGKWQNLYLSEIKDGQQILDWIKSTENRLWYSPGEA